jgi:hypothetical protein
MLGKDFEMILGMSNAFFQYNECTPETITQFMETFASMEFDQDRMFIEVSRRHTVSILGSHSVMEDSGDHEPWLNTTTGDAIREINWHYWDHYKDYLNHKGFSKGVVKNLDDITTDILSRIEDPRRSGAWDRRGLVMGSVQSGKTANYTGLIAKAIDAGYKMVVILTGVHNSLRSQTQIRVNDELVGYDSEKAFRMEDISYRRIGVSRRFPTHRERDEGMLQTLTTSDEKGDFKKVVAERANYTPSLPYVLVIKKHVSILKNLVDWLALTAGEEDESGRIRVTDIPLLVIDDECDQASVNTKKVVRDPDTNAVNEECDPTMTNMRIRALLSTFDKSAYVGYTATPYANVFIHHDSKHPKYGPDIFPRNFIFNIPQPDNYVGASKLFGLKDSDPEAIAPLPLLGEPVGDSDDIFPPNNSQKDLAVARLPESLKSAIREFVIVCAAKRERATRNPHNSMLIHVTRFTNMQNRVHELVIQEIRHLRGRIANSSDDLKDLRDIWEQKYMPVSMEMPSDDDIEIPVHHWDDLVKHLPEMVRRISVKAINGTSKDALLYKEVEDSADKKRQRGEEVPWEDSGAHVIAIGGDKLSRGLTLEGLTTTYYLRPSSMSDTLMQMGRWFGYRPGYLDLCRTYTTVDIISFFQQIAKAEEDLRNQFDHMTMLGMEPKDFGLAVLEDPGMLMVTNSGKRRDTKVIEQSFAGRISQTINFDLSSSAHNLRVLGNLVMDCESKGAVGASRKAHHWSGVPKSVVCEFLNNYRGHGGATLVRSDVISSFIQEQVDQDMSQWDVAILSKSRAAHKFTLGGKSVGCWNRKSSGAIEGNSLRIGTLVSPEDEWIDFTEDEKKECRTDYRMMKTRKTRDGGEDLGDSRPPGAFIRYSRPRERGLLLVYPICFVDDPEPSNRYGATAGEEIYGFAVSFPSDSNRHRFTKKRVRVNQTFIDDYW